MNTIRLKKFVDIKGITLKELSQQTDIDIEDLEQMYEDSVFDGDKLGVNKLTDLMQALDILNISDLIPSIK